MKEYKNPFSGVDLPKCGTMNGSTYLPKDKDPGIEIERQLKLQLDEMKLEGIYYRLLNTHNNIDGGTVT